MDFQEFPKWKYRGAKAVLVNNKQEESDLGSGWADAPADPLELPPEVDPRDAEIARLKEQLANLNQPKSVAPASGRKAG